MEHTSAGDPGRAILFFSCICLNYLLPHLLKGFEILELAADWQMDPYSVLASTFHILNCVTVGISSQMESNLSLLLCHSDCLVNLSGKSARFDC
jgi:hypothetical protein